MLFKDQETLQESLRKMSGKVVGGSLRVEVFGIGGKEVDLRIIVEFL
jgi:hypothetical protein